MPRLGNKMTGRADFQEKRENAMRPSRYLGYDHDRLGIYFLGKEATSLAEIELRRAVWLNPFEPDFKVHLAMCLFQQKRYAEAMELAHQALEHTPNHADAKELVRLAEGRIPRSNESRLNAGENGGA